MRRQPLSNHSLVIDTRPRHSSGLLAGELVLGKSILRHTMDHANALIHSGHAIDILTWEHDQAEVRSLLDPRDMSSFRLTTAEPSTGCSVLRTDRLYERKKLRRALSAGKSPESAVLWRLDNEHAIQVASDELKRRQSYQPIGRYWAFPIARALARSLVHTPVRPNALTLSAGFLMLAAAAMVAIAPLMWEIQGVIALILAIALVLDTADGHLARLQGTASPFGRWLDHILDELADVALHGAIAWASFAQTQSPAWLVIGMLYAAGKYLFLVQSIAGDELDHGIAITEGPVETTESPSLSSHGTNKNQSFVSEIQSVVRVIVRGLGHADFRWHLWIVLAAFGRLDLGLIIYAGYYPLRSGARCLSRGVEHALS